MIQPWQSKEMKSILQTDLSDGKHAWVFVIKQFKIHSNVFILLFLKINWNRCKAVDSGIRFRGDLESIRRCRLFAVHVTAAKGRRRRRREGTGRKGVGGNNTGV
jgi:hypothetical protein